MGWEPEARRLEIFDEHTANRMRLERTRRVLLEVLTFAESRNKEYLRNRDGGWLNEIPEGMTTRSTRCATP